MAYISLCFEQLEFLDLHVSNNYLALLKMLSFIAFEMLFQDGPLTRRRRIEGAEIHRVFILPEGVV